MLALRTRVILVAWGIGNNTPKAERQPEGLARTSIKLSQRYALLVSKKGRKQIVQVQCPKLLR